MSLFVITTALLVVQAFAYPENWVDKAASFEDQNACDIPRENDFGYKSHTAVESDDPSVTFKLQDDKKAVVTTFTPGMMYTLTVSYKSPASIYTVVEYGELTQIGENPLFGQGCNQKEEGPFKAAYMMPQQKTPVSKDFAVSWTAPDDCDPVMIYASVSTGESSNFFQNQVSIPCGGAGSTPAAATPPTVANTTSMPPPAAPVAAPTTPAASSAVKALAGVVAVAASVVALLL